ncbi:hypothetical protein BDV95DRAFT_627855 [Massariosphaeria phaeospora]|uniref:Uncharacterized protein n=1 Tax=Massariosphaeria phaeospora TaxID=100035 RepID=A0A7C8MAQ8_9PLEO|nr:hypothetical protein BDV95DRAFT_627855 [Massariosphaeria phaeospora]
MFVPRALRLKGVKEKKAPKNAASSHKDQEPQTQTPVKQTQTESADTPVEAMQRTSTTSTLLAPEHIDPQKAISRGPRFTTTPVTPEYIAILAAGIDLIFTDYAFQNAESASWLHTRYRVVAGEDKFVHLSAILEHPNISTLKPVATQTLLRQAVEGHLLASFDISDNGYFVRRKPSSYPLPFIPANASDVVNDEGLSFWDQRTIYVEPHTRAFCKTPARVAHWLREHGEMKNKWLPIQAVQTLWNSCAFVILSGNVTHEDPWQKWRSLEKPEYWKIMTKMEHTKRTEEYMQLLAIDNPKPNRKRTLETASKRSDIVHTSTTSDANDKSKVEEPPGKTKRKRKRPAKNTGDKVGVENTHMAAPQEVANGVSNKKLKT